MINTNKFNDIDNFIDTSKYNGENISHLLGCAEIFGQDKEKAIQDDNEFPARKTLIYQWNRSEKAL